MNATSQHNGGPPLWTPPQENLRGPNSLDGPLGHPPHPPPRLPPPHLLRGPPPRGPFFIREIYKNGYLKRLPHNEKKSSALSKLLRSDRYWVVFSVHDDVMPFLELWNEPTEVASKPPQLMFPLAVCQHISPSLIPADNEWSFVVNFETVAIRFSCNSRQVMEEWVEVIRMKLGEMGILNPKGNLYSKVPPQKPSTGRNPMSPLPQPPVEPEPAPEPTECNGNQPRTRTSIVDASDETNQTFTTSIYLNQTPPPQPRGAAATPATPSRGGQKRHVIPAKSYEQIQIHPETTSKTSVYLNKDSNPARHVTVIPINNRVGGAEGGEEHKERILPSKREEIQEESYYDAIFEFDQPVQKKTLVKSNSAAPKVPLAKSHSANTKKRQQSPPRLARQSEPLPPPPPPSSNYETILLDPDRRDRERRRRASREELRTSSPNKSAVSRRCSDRKNTTNSATPSNGPQQAPKKKSQRSSSLGPLLDEPVDQKRDSNMLQAQARATNTNSLESIDSNPRQAVAKSYERRGDPQAAIRVMRAAASHGHPRRPPLPVATTSTTELSTSPNTTQPPSLQPQRHLSTSGGGGPAHYPPHIPLPGLTCQLSFVPSGDQTSNPAHPTRSQTLRDQQVKRLRQEIMHPAGVRLTLRKRDCQNSLALVEFFGCVWVAGWKQREFPVLYNAFHVGDQILTVSGIPIKTVSEFNKHVRQKSASSQASGPPTSSTNLTTNQSSFEHLPHVEIIVRRLPFAQVFHLKREVDAQPLGIVLNNATAEIKEIVPGSPAGLVGMTPKIRSFNDSSVLVPWCITEVNGRPLNLFGKEGETVERLQAIGRDISVTLQPADIVNKVRKNLKSVKNHKEYLLN